MTEITKYLSKIIGGEDLQLEEITRIFTIIAKNSATPAQIGAILSALQTRGLSPEIIAGATIAMQHKMIPFETSPELQTQIIDNCGTGGDGKGTYNISTAASFVIAGAGIPIAKHGNNSVSSRSGSADVLSALGVNLDITPDQAKECLEHAGICFLYARLFHPAMKIVAPIRKELGVRTIFNVLGPLLNPARPKRQIIGVYSKELVKPICETLKHLGHQHAIVVHGEDGLDEISTTARSFVAELKDGNIEEYIISAEDFNITSPHPKDLIGGDSIENSKALNAVLNGKESAYYDAVILNAGAAIYISGQARSISEGIEKARHSIQSGAAINCLKKLVEITNNPHQEN